MTWIRKSKLLIICTSCWPIHSIKRGLRDWFSNFCPCNYRYMNWIIMHLYVKGDEIHPSLYSPVEGRQWRSCSERRRRHWESSRNPLEHWRGPVVRTHCRAGSSCCTSGRPWWTRWTTQRCSSFVQQSAETFN